MEALKQYGTFVAAAILALAGFALGQYAVMAWLAAAVLVCVGVVALSPRWGALSAAALGFACSAYLFQLKLTPGKTSICDVSATVSCDVVNSSAASMIFGIPIAVLGMGFFLGVAIAVIALTPGPGSRLFQTVGLLAVLGCVYSVFLAFAAIQIGATCPMCMAIYASNALLLATAVIGVRSEQIGLLDGLGDVLKSPALLTIGATFVVVTLVGQGIYGSQDRRTDAERLMDRMAERSPEPAPPSAGSNGEDHGHDHDHPHPKRVVPPGPRTIEQELTDLYVRPRGAIQIAPDEPVLGDPNAPYVLVEYACFGCPHCAQAFVHLRELVDEMPQVQVRFRSFPLSNECNPVLPRGGRPEVCRGAMAARCAQNQGKFWDFAGMLFANQQQLGDPLLAAAAERVGLDYEQFSSCLADQGTLQRVMQDASSGVALQIQGTPTMLLQGVTADGSWVELCGGADAAKALIKAKEEGIQLLPAEARMCPLE